MRPLGSRRQQDQIAKVAPAKQPAVYEAATLNRTLDHLAERVNELTDTATAVFDLELATGINAIAHGLNRRPSRVRVIPAAADAAFAWAWDPDQPDNPTPTLHTRITVVGGPMQARVIVE